MSVMLACGLKKEEKNLYTLNRKKAVLTMGSTSAYGYTGKWQRETDPLTGRIRMGIREYQPELGRFTATWT
ncbi:hypothetical protein BMS3Abin01_00784 [bacterium BMS3Abin01]|nr:hypothetical protein BMS3Abin01_00784 [bacterium BMS3Abin01]